MGLPLRDDPHFSRRSLGASRWRLGVSTRSQPSRPNQTLCTTCGNPARGRAVMRVRCFGECRDDLALVRRRMPTATSPPRPSSPARPAGKFQFTPYGWLPWVEGDAVVRGRSFEVSENAGAGARIPRLCLDELHAGAAGRGDAVLRRHLCRRHQSTRSPPRKRSRRTSAARWVQRCRPTTATGSSKWAACTRPTAGFWQQLRRRDRYLARDARRRALLAPGARRQRGAGRHAQCRRPRRLRTTALARSGGVHWIDPFMGMRLHYKPTVGEEFIVRGDIGGFGLGSQFTWHVIATYNWFLFSTTA